MADGNPQTPAQGALPLEPAAVPSPPGVIAATESPAAAAPAPAPEPAAAVAAPPAPEPAKTELSTDKPSLLEGVGNDDAAKAPPAEPAKPVEAKKDGAAAKVEEPAKTEPEKAAEAAKAEEKVEAKPEVKPEVKAEPEKPLDPAAELAAKIAALPPAEYKYTLPDTMKMDDALKEATHHALDAFRADPNNVQPLIDLHEQTMKQYAENLAAETLANQHKAFNETRSGWNKEIMADPILGGSGHNTAMQAVARMRDLLVPKEAMAPRKWDNGQPRLSQFEEFLRVTGAGDHPVFHHILHNAARYLDEPGLPPENPQPPPDLGRPNGRGSKVLYDHPRSPNNRQ